MSNENSCGGYHCSEEHGHIDCEPSWCAQWLQFVDNAWFYYDPSNERYGPFLTRAAAIASMCANPYGDKEPPADDPFPNPRQP